MPTIYDWKGNRHDLTMGAFDSSSLQNTHMADIKLFGGLASIENGQEKALFQQLTQSYLRNKVDPTIWERFKKQLPNLANIGGTLGTNLLMAKIKALAGPNPILQSAITSAEIVLGTIFTGKQKKSFREPMPGQWVFVESDPSYRRRLAKIAWANDNSLHKPEAAPSPETIEEASSKWGVAFYLRNSSDSGHGVVYDVGANREREVRVAQLVNVPVDLAKKLDADDDLSVLRELYILSHSPDRKRTPDNNLSMGKLIKRVKDDVEMRIISSSETGLMAVGEDGHVRHLLKTEVRPVGKSVSTPGLYDDYFLKDGRSKFYAGMWCWTQARDWVIENFPCDYELVCFTTIDTDGMAKVYYVLDGGAAHIHKNDLLPCNSDDQAAFNSDKALKRFLIAASRDISSFTKGVRPLEKLYKYVTKGRSSKQKQTKPPPGDFPEPQKTETMGEVKGPEREDPKTLDKLEEAFQKQQSDLNVYGQEISIMETQINEQEARLKARINEELDDDSGMGMGLIAVVAVGLILANLVA